MKQFKDFKIKTELPNFTGDKIKIPRLLNCEITIMDYMIKDSKFGKNNEKCLYLQIEFKGRKHVIFTGSIVLLEMIQKVPKSDFPFKTIIIKEDEHFEFS